MSLGDKHTVRTETMEYDPWRKEKEKAKYIEQQHGTKQNSESLSIQKNLNNWILILQVNEYGKAELIARRTLGKLVGGKSNDNESILTVTVESSENLVPKLKQADYDRSNPKFIEVDDGQNRTTETFEGRDNERYKRQWLSSSVVTTMELFQELFPDFESMLQETQLDDYSKKLAESASKVQKPYTRNYKNYVK